MKKDRIQITYVTSKIPEDDLCTLCNRLVAELPVEFQRVRTVQEIFPVLNLSMGQAKGLPLELVS